MRQKVLKLVVLLSVCATAGSAQGRVKLDSLVPRASGCYVISARMDSLPGTLRLSQEPSHALGYHRTSSFKTNWVRRRDWYAAPIWNAVGADSIEVELSPLPMVALGPMLEELRLRWYPDSLVGVHQTYQLRRAPGSPGVIKVVEKTRRLAWRRVACLEQRSAYSAGKAGQHRTTKPSNDR